MEEAKALRALLPELDSYLIVGSSASDPVDFDALLRRLELDVAEGDADEAVDRRIVELLATQTAWNRVRLRYPSDRVSRLFGAALRRNNATWHDLYVSEKAFSNALPVLAGLGTNRTLRTLLLRRTRLASSAAYCAAIAAALRSEGSALRKLSLCECHLSPPATAQLLLAVSRSLTLLSLCFKHVRVDGGEAELSDVTAALAATLRDAPLYRLRFEHLPWLGLAWPVDTPVSSERPLRRLCLDNCDLGPAAAEAIARQTALLAALRLSGNMRIGNASGERLASAISGSALTVVCLNRCGLGATAAAKLGEALAAAPCLVYLHVERNPAIGDAGVAALARGMARNTALRIVRLGRCGAGSAAAAALAVALADSSIVMLSLAYSETLGDTAGAKVVAALRRNTALRWLDLTKCGLGLETARACGKVLGAGQFLLRELVLSYNASILDAGAAALCSGLAKNRELRRLDLIGSGVSPRVLKEVRASGQHPDFVLHDTRR